MTIPVDKYLLTKYNYVVILVGRITSKIMNSANTFNYHVMVVNVHIRWYIAKKINNVHYNANQNVS